VEELEHHLTLVHLLLVRHQHLHLTQEMVVEVVVHHFKTQRPHSLVVAEVVVDKMEIWEEHQAIKVIQVEMEEMVVDLDHG
jgi:hypothetical protein